MGEFNIAPNTQIGRIVIPEKVYDDENAYSIEESKYSRGGEFIENLVTDNMIEYCHRWFKLANIKEFIEDLDEFLALRSGLIYSNLINAGFGRTCSPILPTSTDIHQPISFGAPKVSSPIRFNTERNKDYNYDNLYYNKKGVN